jgi:hypothetical protein
MAVGTSELVRGFQLVKVQPQAPSLTEMVSICGHCGSLIADGFESKHNTYHASNPTNGGMATRNARGPFESNAP